MAPHEQCLAKSGQQNGNEAHSKPVVIRAKRQRKSPKRGLNLLDRRKRIILKTGQPWRALKRGLVC